MSQNPILILTTGGTIDKAYFDALSAYQIVDSVIPKILDTALVRHPYRVEQMFRKDSLDLTDGDRADIRDHVAAADERHIVITHGTDTMTTTAQALGGIQDKTIVLVGALAPARFQESDAMFNIGMAFAAAQTAAPGLYITMNGSVFRADAVVKDRAQGAFVSRPASSA
ncbi:asparaginase domain-containing protein [Sphingobium subterraneum]|uniref:L-asparaginase n=1 Tax=Sphingobium subterraneum TaxID=627688 RepID=A0A841J7N2_9SPHN|nr:asparaginase domain-containing protein [Sphingobium subterraneum]MBB6124568.1 L-asparaginase [Sphingobium subterraneum]